MKFQFNLKTFEDLTISKVSALEFKDNVKKKKKWAKTLDQLVKNSDLIVAEAKFDSIRYTNFSNKAPSSHQKLHHDNETSI